MKQVVVLLVLFVGFISCKNKQKNDMQKQVHRATEKEPTDPSETEIWKPIPPKISVNKKGVPSDAIVLFDGSNFKEWTHSKDGSAVKWHLNSDGSMTVKDKTGDIQTKRSFGSVQLHLEWKSSPKNTAKGQARSNSGVFLQDRYEVQILDNNQNPTYVNGMVASVYKQSIPLAMASVPTGMWNVYDIIFHAPQFDSKGNKSKSGTITVLHNGILVQDNFKIKGTTEYIGCPKNNAHSKAPIKLQDHRDKSGVSYRNIWIRNLD